MPMSPRLLRPVAAGGFNPKRLAGLSAWYDATVASSITLVSDYVSQWSDLSGAGHHLTQSVEADRPALGTISGKTAIDLDGSNDYLSNAAAPSGWEFGTIFCVHERDGGGNQNVYGITAASNNTMYCSVNNINAEYRSGGGGGGVGGIRSTGVVTNSTPRLLTQTADNSSVYGLRLDAATASGTTGGFNNNVQGTYLGCRNSATLGLGLFFDGKVGEFIVYDRVLSASEITKVENYLALKWGITLAPTATNPEAVDWINRVYANGGTVSTSTANAVDAFCNAIDAAGIRSKFYRLNLFAGTGLNAALVPLYRGPTSGGTQYGNTTDTNVGPFVNGDYAETGASGGLTSNGTSKYLNTGLKADALGQTDRHLSMVGVTTGASTSKYFLGMDNFGCGGNAFWGIMTGSSTASQFMVRAQSAAANSTSFTASGTPHIVLSGNGSATAYADGVAAVTGPAGAFTAPNLDIYTHALNRCGTSVDYTAARLTAYSVGAAFTAQQASDFYTAMNAFQTALSRA